MEFSSTEIVQILNDLGYAYEGSEHTSVLKGICPNSQHNDRSIGSFVIWPNGACRCFSCGWTGDIINFVMELRGYSFKEAAQFVGKDDSGPRNIDFKARRRVRKAQEQRETLPPMFPQGRPFDPPKFDYTRQRGYTKEYVDHFGLYYCDKGSYKTHNLETDKEEDILLYDYMITPVGQLWEARDIKRDKPNKPKTHYPKYSKINHTIFNEPNLSRYEPLFISEGAGSHPKLWTHVSKNSTFIFGAALTLEQYLILRDFKSTVWIPDPDKAGIELVETIQSLFVNAFILDVKSDDKEDGYVDGVLNAERLTPSSYLLRRYGLLYA